MATNGMNMIGYGAVSSSMGGASLAGVERNIGQRTAALAARGVEVTACSTCCRFRGLARDDLVEGVALGGMGVLTRMVDECDRIVTLGI